VKPIKILIKYVIKITRSFKTVYNFLLVFIDFITGLNEMI